MGGTCETGGTVSLSGGASGSVSCADGTYSFSVAKTGDGTYSLSVIQSDGIHESTASSLTWILDSTAPAVQIDSAPSDPNLAADATFSFSSTDAGATFECDLDGGGFASCVSPLTYASVAPGAHTFTLRARDAAGNVSGDVTHAWTQETVQTVALYHFDTGPESGDSGAYANDLTDVGTAPLASGRFGEGRTLVAAEGDHLVAADDASLATVASTMTVEAYVNFSSLPATNGERMVIAGQSASDANCENACGWMFGVTKQGGRNSFRVFFGASVDAGATLTLVTSSAQTFNVGSWHHIAVTWNLGSATIYLDGVSVYSGAIGTAGSATIHDSAADLMVGASALGEYLDGGIDELRISNVVRASFPPAAPYTAD